MARGLILMRFNAASVYPSVTLERQDGVLTSIGREDWHPQRAAFDAATETNAARECYSLYPSVTWMFGARIDQRRRAPASSRPRHPPAKHAGGDDEANDTGIAVRPHQ